jgi:methylated-DNA-[protein]-cysteine S-methyltransferase
MDDVKERRPLTGRALRRRLRELLIADDQDAVAALADDDHRVLGALITLTYDADPDLAWRALHGLGRAAEQIADREPDAVRNYLRRLFWLITEESGGICWFAPQGLAEIAGRRPDRFGDFIPVTINLLNEMAEEDLEHFRPGTLWAIGRLGPLAAEHLADVEEQLVAALDHDDPRVRGLAVWAMGETGWTAPVEARPRLLEDHATLRLFDDGTLGTTSVADLARRALR